MQVVMSSVNRMHLAARWRMPSEIRRGHEQEKVDSRIEQAREKKLGYLIII